MSAGLGLVISEYSAANLDTDLPFIDVVPEDKITDIEYVTNLLEKNRKVSVNMRNEIREYAKTFGWETIVSEVYFPTVRAASKYKTLAFNTQGV